MMVCINKPCFLPLLCASSIVYCHCCCMTICFITSIVTFFICMTHFIICTSFISSNIACPSLSVLCKWMLRIWFDLMSVLLFFFCQLSVFLFVCFYMSGPLMPCWNNVHLYLNFFPITSNVWRFLQIFFFPHVFNALVCWWPTTVFFSYEDT